MTPFFSLSRKNQSTITTITTNAFPLCYGTNEKLQRVCVPSEPPTHHNCIIIHQSILKHETKHNTSSSWLPRQTSNSALLPVQQDLHTIQHIRKRYTPNLTVDQNPTRTRSFLSLR
mmetsp:Transcript_7000/g.14350  ORF Transcript_7000/g.14350 Transcript_7000/m.14350 type:complete len:116 (+) Transcript_7000:1538-1885(+)